MYKRPTFSFINPFVFLILVLSFGIIINCADSLDKSPVSSIPDSQIPDDIAPVSSPTNSLQIKGGTIEKNKVILYLRFETDKDKTHNLLLRLSSSDSSYTFYEILNREPNNFISYVTYKYIVNGLSPNTEYYVWIVIEDFNGFEILNQIETHFTTLSE